MNKLKEQIELIRLASLVGTDAKNPEQKLLDYVSQLLQESNEEAVREFVERYLERVRTQTFVHKDMPNFMKQYLKEIKE